MIIRKSYGNCKNCRLLESESCILETNTGKNLNETEILFIAENPGKDEVIEGRPLVGKSGKEFRTHFDKYFKDDFKWTISNCVLCLTLKPNGNTGNPTKEDIENCKPNIFKLVKTCNPKIIFLMGSTPMSLFGIAKSGIITKSYQYYEWNNRKIYLVPHPSYISNYCHKPEEKKNYSKGFLEVRQFLGKGDPDDEFDLNNLLLDNDEEENIVEIQSEKKDKTIIKEGSDDDQYNNHNIFNPTLNTFTLPEKFYTKKYRLIDCQYISKQDRLFFIFRDDNNEKIFYEPPRVSNNYYYYKTNGTGKCIENIKDLQLINCNYKERKQNQECYGSDVPLENLHCVDYYLQNKEDATIIKRNILFLDIEVFTYGDRSFPTPDKALFPIDLISFAIDDGEIQTFLLKLDEIDPRIDDVLEKRKNWNITVFNNESEMLREFANTLKTLSPDIMSAWNLPFDIGYIFNRMRRLNVNPNQLSPFDNCWIDTRNNNCLISGFVLVDMLDLYKTFSQNQEVSNTLQAISMKELGVGKLQTSVPLIEEYTKSIDEHIEYNRVDVQRIQQINNQVRHIEMMDELRKTSTTSWKGASSTIGQSDGLFLTNLKKRGMYPKNRNDHPEKRSIPGAYVKQPIGGIYEYMCDWDFSSLYPNLVRSYNIGPNTYLCKIDKELARLIIYENYIEKNPDMMVTVWWDPVHKNSKENMTLKELNNRINEYKGIINISGCIFKGHEIEQSIFFEIYNFLLENRKLYKKEKFEAGKRGDKIEEKVFDNKQWALKILANSLYGVLLNEYFRFYNADLGESITLGGQEAIRFSGYHLNKYMEDGKWTIDVAYWKKVEEELSYLTYIDTDSLFVRIGDYLKDKKNIKELNDEKILDGVKNLDPILNNEILGEFIKLHNIPKEYSYLDLKQEIIADKAYFLSSKKRYALHITNQEGYEKDKIDIKGIETRRSDYPEITKEMITKILDMILKNKELDVDEVLDYVDKIRTRVTELAHDGDKSVARPASWAKPLKEYKSVPDNVRGMQLWNSIVYNVFKHGSKGSKFNILAIDDEKAPDFVKENLSTKTIKREKVVVIPEEVDKLPEYFIPDVKKIVAFSVDDRVDLLLEPLLHKSDDMLLF